MPRFQLNDNIVSGLVFCVCLAAGASVSAQTTQATPAAPATTAAPAATVPAAPEISAETTTKSAPFPGDWTWLNSNGRVVDTPMATKYFTPEIRADVNYIFDFNHPKDDTMGGSTESFRSQEFQLEQLSFGGDFRLNNARARFLSQRCELQPWPMGPGQRLPVCL
jgi:hypothetical protein